MKLESPPSRYRIVEKGGRLIVTDTVTGQRNASADLPTMYDLGHTRATLGPPSARVSEPVAVPDPERSTPKTKQPSAGMHAPASVNQARLILLLVGFVFAVAVLMLTWLWVPLAIALLFPQVRRPLLETGRKTMKSLFAA